MSSIYVISNESYSGKSSICIGLSLILKEMGKEVGYFKPIGTLPTKIGELVNDEDAYFAHKLLKSVDPLEDISPVMLTSLSYKEGLPDTPGNSLSRIINSFNLIKKGKDIVIIEGSKSIFDWLFFNLSVLDLYDKFDSRILLVVNYSSDLIDIVLALKRMVNDSLIGVIINKVPRSQLEWVESIVVGHLSERNVKVYGIIIRDPSLSSISIEELAENLGGQILCANDKRSEFIETFMVGAMGQEQALRYFRRKANKAVITGGDRADVQLAALETQTKCLVLTGNLRPSLIVISRAEELGVPVMLVEADTLSTVQKAEELIGRIRVHDVEKVRKLVDVLREYVDLKDIFADVGLKVE